LIFSAAASSSIVTDAELEEIIRPACSNEALPTSHTVIEYRITDPKAPESATIDDGAGKAE